MVPGDMALHKVLLFRSILNHVSKHLRKQVLRSIIRIGV